ncbi:hypothetical protein BDV97DRAFT_343717 [Delphinella strobiligena]|nr:hypothetical protein BDV97DRAFT_343717 [Delphinella strobiligena]
MSSALPVSLPITIPVPVTTVIVPVFLGSRRPRPFSLTSTDARPLDIRWPAPGDVIDGGRFVQPWPLRTRLPVLPVFSTLPLPPFLVLCGFLSLCGLSFPPPLSPLFSFLFLCSFSLEEVFCFADLAALFFFLSLALFFFLFAFADRGFLVAQVAFFFFEFSSFAPEAVAF